MTNNAKITIHKSTILNWLYSYDDIIDIEDLAKWIEAKSSGRYKFVKQSSDNTPEMLAKLSNE